jgi:hypothetical protein
MFDSVELVNDELMLQRSAMMQSQTLVRIVCTNLACYPFWNSSRSKDNQRSTTVFTITCCKFVDCCTHLSIAVGSEWWIYSNLSNVFRMLERKRDRYMLLRDQLQQRTPQAENDLEFCLCSGTLSEPQMMSMPLASVSLWLSIRDHHFVLAFASCYYCPRASLPMYMFVNGTRVSSIARLRAHIFFS